MNKIRKFGRRSYPKNQLWHLPKRKKVMKIKPRFIKLSWSDKLIVLLSMISYDLVEYFHNYFFN